MESFDAVTPHGRLLSEFTITRLAEDRQGDRRDDDQVGAAHRRAQRLQVDQLQIVPRRGFAAPEEEAALALRIALAKPDAIVMHPGPMNRGVEIDSAVADGKHSVILPQVTFGIAVRMAVMSMLAGG